MTHQRTLQTVRYGDEIIPFYTTANVQYNPHNRAEKRSRRERHIKFNTTTTKNNHKTTQTPLKQR